MPAIAGVLAVVMLFAVSLTAQDLVVSKSPVSPDTTHALSGDAFEQPLLAVRLQAAGGDVTVEGFELTVSGTGSPVTQMTGLSVWLDDGDGEFDAQLDTELWSGPSAAAVTVALAPTMLVGDGLFVDVWVVASFASDAGSSLGLTYSIGVADVSVDGGATVTFDPVPPQSTELALVLFRVDRVIHRSCFWIVIEGSGLTPPLQVYVGGVLVEGIMEVNPDHTIASLRYVLPNPVPLKPLTEVEIDTAIVERYATGWHVDFLGVGNFRCFSDGVYNSNVDDDLSCAVTNEPQGVLAILLLVAVLIGTARLKTRRQP